jgi:predicted acylesterase/phospholipase RssA
MLFLKSGPATVREPLTTCFGGGGIFGIGFNLGVGHAFQDRGIPLGSSPMVGTSAGSWTAAALATGKSMDDLVATWENHTPAGKVKAIELTSKAFGEERSPLVTTVAVKIPTFRRHLLSGFHHKLADVVAASSSPPGYASPHTIGSTRFVDGAIVSNTSANKCVNADLLVVITPLDRRVMTPYGHYAESAVWLEIAQWRQRNWGQTLLIRPSDEISRMAGKGPSAMVEADRGAEVYEAAYAYGLDRAERFLEKYPQHGRPAGPAPATAVSA